MPYVSLLNEYINATNSDDKEFFKSEIFEQAKQTGKKLSETSIFLLQIIALLNNFLKTAPLSLALGIAPSAIANTQALM